MCDREFSPHGADHLAADAPRDPLSALQSVEIPAGDSERRSGSVAAQSRTERNTPMSDMERRATPRAVELRSIAGSRSIGGYALTFDRLSQNLGGYVERIAPSFPNKSRAAGWAGIICRYNHDDAFLLAATRNNTLRLTVDRTGVDYTASLPECRNDVLEWVSRGDIGSSSFAFQTHEDDWGLTDGGVPLRTLVSGRILDVAPVSQPAYLDTSVGLRSLAQHMDAPIEDVLALSSENELRRLFVRTDLSPAQAKARIAAKARLSGATALAQTKAKAPKPVSGVAAKMALLGKRHSRVIA
jgi:HK97 family phage prohead protease